MVAMLIVERPYNCKNDALIVGGCGYCFISTYPYYISSIVTVVIEQTQRSLSLQH